MQRRREEKKKELAELEFKNQEEFKRKREANIMLIGDSIVGKTSLVNVYAGKGF